MSEAALVKQEPKPQPKTPVAWDKSGAKIDSLEGAYRWAQMAVASGFLPESLNKPEAVVIALQAGMELGLTPWQAVQSIVVIKGTPTIRVETARALVEAQGLLEPGTKLYHRFEGEGDALKCVLWSFPRGSSKPIESEFTWLDAKTAGLTGKDNYKSWPKRMLLARATGFHIRDYYPTAIRRVPFADEVTDIEVRRGRTERDVTPPSAKRVSSLLAAKVGPSTADKIEQVLREDLLPDCPHPEGFAPIEEGGARVCVECGLEESVA